jgi:hypothetical protein
VVLCQRRLNQTLYLIRSLFFLLFVDLSLGPSTQLGMLSTTGSEKGDDGDEDRDYDKGAIGLVG